MVAADWPDHQNKEWRITIQLCRDYGWPKPHWTSNHPKLIMKCPAGEPACTVTAFSTGEGTETVAISSRRKIARCPHRDVTTPLAAADVSLNAADRLISGAETLVRRGAMSDKIEQLLILVDSAVDEATRSLEVEFDDAHAELGVLTDEAERLLEGDPDAATVADAAESAQPHLRNAQVTLAPLPSRSPSVAERQDRLDALVARRNALL